ncbi:hypothetical protein H6A07_02170 [Olsenella uli]|uniref:hypothetical protein n=1 Tax=Olsenella uli TaxID=133926 RepID=UPI001958E139|nr:hypothetical protein [Olsenella uli]MBM6675552.1 hypothetical protein [Olsenella uli]
MSEEILGEYRRASRMARIGTVCMYAIAALFVVIALVSVSASVRDGLPRDASVAIRLLKHATAITTTVLLAEFLRHFGRSSSPFGRGQSLRLVTAGLLLVLSTMFDLFGIAPSYDVQLLGGTLSFGATSQPGINPLMFSFAVFLFCLALVTRYGNLLKEDSDSIA